MKKNEVEIGQAYAAIIREIATKGDKSRFKRGSKRGTFQAICTPDQKRELFAKKA